MSNEITIGCSLAVLKLLSAESFNPGQIYDDQTTIGSHVPTVSVPTTEAVISFGSLVAPKWVAWRNLDATNYVQIGPESAGAMVPAIRIGPGKTSGAISIEPGSVWRWKSHTGICQVKMIALET